MKPAQLQVTVNTGAFDDAPEALLEAAVRSTVARQEGAPGEVSVTLLDDAGIRELNRDYLGKDAATDVISFSLGDEGTILGDIYVGVTQARRQAEDLGVPLQEELVRLVIHGTLHLLGHDHPEGPERGDSPMYALQEAYLQAVLSGEGEAGG